MVTITRETIGASIAAMMAKPEVRKRMATIGALENEIYRQAVDLGKSYADGISNEREVQRAIRVQIDLWTDEHTLNQQERLHLFRMAHRVAKVPQF